MAKTVIRENTAPAGREIATLGGGCFWCLEAVFDDLKGVDSVESGYTGGKIPHPTYEQICDGDTEHAEVVRVVFDPKVLTFRDLLGVFFAIHDPTTPNRQGNDVGTQYRSAIFYHSQEQKRDAEAVIAELTAAREFRDPIVTQVVPAETLYVAEDYHQEYFARNADRNPYCAYVVAPKVQKFRKEFAARAKSLGR
jgi:peptide-methionine (S)-S-oxide reductase